MTESILVAATLLVCQTGDPPHPGDKEKTRSKGAVEADLQKAKSEYNVLKEKTPMTAAARWKLTLGCEEHGLKEIACVHFGDT